MLLSSPFSGFLRTFQDGLGGSSLGRPPPHLQLPLATSTLTDDHLELPWSQHRLPNVLDAALPDRITGARTIGHRASQEKIKTRYSRRMVFLLCRIIEGDRQFSGFHTPLEASTLTLASASASNHFPFLLLMGVLAKTRLSLKATWGQTSSMHGANLPSWYTTFEATKLWVLRFLPEDPGLLACLDVRRKASPIPELKEETTVHHGNA